MTKLFKNPILGPFSAFFTQISVKMNCSEKGLSQFLNIPVMCHRAKNPIILMTHSSKKRRTDSLIEVWQFKPSERSLIVGIELFPESLSIFNSGFFLLCFPF